MSGIYPAAIRRRFINIAVFQFPLAFVRIITKRSLDFREGFVRGVRHSALGVTSNGDDFCLSVVESEFGGLRVLIAEAQILDFNFTVWMRSHLEVSFRKKHDFLFSKVEVIAGVDFDVHLASVLFVTVTLEVVFIIIFFEVNDEGMGSIVDSVV